MNREYTLSTKQKPFWSPLMFTTSRHSCSFILKGEELLLHPISPTDPRLTQKDRCMHSRVQQVQPETASPTGYPICYRLAVLTTSRGTWLKVCKQNPAPKLRQEGKSGLVTFSDKKQIEKKCSAFLLVCLFIILIELCIL